MADPIERGRQRRLRADFNRRHRKSITVSKAISVDLKRGILSFRKGINLADITRALRTGKLTEVFKAIPWKRLDKALAPALDKLGGTAVRAAESSLDSLPAKRELRYDTQNPAMDRYLDQQTGNLITTLQDGTLDAVRANTRKAFEQGLTPQQVADNIRGSIGLNARQAVALANYREAKSQDPSLSPGRVDQLATEYEQRLLDQRAILIARTETRFAENAGQQAVWDAASEQGLMPEAAKRVWVVDGNPCPELCLPMDGVAVGLDEPWELPNGKRVQNPTESHPNCFCLASLVLN